MKKATPLAYGQRLPITWCRRGRRVAFGSALSQGRIRENGAMLFEGDRYESAGIGGPVMTCLGTGNRACRSSTRAGRRRYRRVWESGDWLVAAGIYRIMTWSRSGLTARAALFMSRGTFYISCRCRRDRDHCGQPCFLSSGQGPVP
jgi:hypothetical protein